MTIRRTNSLSRCTHMMLRLGLPASATAACETLESRSQAVVAGPQPKAMQEHRQGA